MDNKISICASMPMHSYQTGTALVNAGLLDRYYTSVYNDYSLIYRLMEKVLPQRIASRVVNKRCNSLSNNIKKYCELEGLILVGGGYIPFLRNHTLDILHHMNKRFGVKVGNDLLRNKTKAVIAYDTYAEHLFYYLEGRKASIIKILDMASISSKAISEIIDRECFKDYPLIDSMEGKKQVYSEENVKANLHEIQMADYLLAGSKFVAKTLVDSGVQEDRIKLVPYGIDINKFGYKHKVIKEKECLIFLFVGRVEAAKGIWYLLEAFRDRRVADRNIRLRVIGDIRTNPHYLDKYYNVSFEGLKQPNELPEIYKQCDVYISPSLWEGCSFSLLEAMASGLPAVATNESSGPEVITEGKDGFVIDSANTDSIVNAIIWFDENREFIPLMSASARKKIENYYTEEKYYERLVEAVSDIIFNGKKNRI